MNGRKDKGQILKEMEALKKDEDLIYLDDAFCAYILEQTNYVKAKAEMIENLVSGFKEKTGILPAGMIPSHDLINELSKAVNYLEKAHTRLAIELVRLKSMQTFQQAYSSEELPKVNDPDPDVSVV